MLAPLCQGNNIASLRIKLKNIRATLSRVRGKKQAAKGPWAAAQQMQQQQRPNSQPLDRNSLQGPPADSSASLSASPAKLVIQALGRQRSMHSSSSAPTATNLTGTALRALL